MPNKNAHDEIVKFVTQPKNLSATMTILLQSDEIKAAALANFWDSIKKSLEASMPKRMAAKPSMVWGFSTHRVENVYRDLSWWSKSFESEKRFASYSVQHYLNAHCFELQVGVGWNTEVPLTSPIQKIKPMQNLYQQLSDTRFSRGEWWVAKEVIEEADSLPDFLKKYGENPKAVVGNICQRFWSVADETFELVEAVNKSIQKM